MTEPRRKEWSFDLDKWGAVCAGYVLALQKSEDCTEALNNIEEFIQSEIQRNLKEFAEQVRPKPHGCMGIYCAICITNRDIDIALKERGVE